MYSTMANICLIIVLFAHTKGNLTKNPAMNHRLNLEECVLCIVIIVCIHLHTNSLLSLDMTTL